MPKRAVAALHAWPMSPTPPASPNQAELTPDQLLAVPPSAARGLGAPACGGDARRFAQYAERALAAAGLPERHTPRELARWAAAACADEGGADSAGRASDGAEGRGTGGEGEAGGAGQVGEGEDGEGSREDRAVAAAGRRLAAFEALRAVLAPVVETLLLTDQLLFLQDGR